MAPSQVRNVVEDDSQCSVTKHNGHTSYVRSYLDRRFGQPLAAFQHGLARWMSRTCSREQCQPPALWWAQMVGKVMKTLIVLNTHKGLQRLGRAMQNLSESVLPRHCHEIWN